MTISRILMGVLLAAVLGGIGQDFPEDDPRRTDMRVVGEKLDQLEAIVTRVLGFAKGSSSLHSRWSLADIVYDTLLLVRLKLAQGKIEVNSAPPARPLLVDVHKGQIQQVLLNLIINATQAMPASVEHAPMTMDFDISSRGTRTAPPAPDLSFDLSGMGDLPVTATPAPAASTDLDFDLGVDVPAAEAPDQLAKAIEALGDDDGDPLMRQLELADEFRQIGDTEGAREVLQELIQRASGPLKARAEAMLNQLR